MSWGPGRPAAGPALAGGTWQVMVLTAGQGRAGGSALGHQGWQHHGHSPEHTALHSSASLALLSRQSLPRCFSLSCFPGKITDAFSSLARKSNFRAISKKLGLVRSQSAREHRALLSPCPGCRLGIPGGHSSGPELLQLLQPAWGLLLGAGATASSPLCPDPVPCECWGFPCPLQTLQWRWAGSPVSSILGRGPRVLAR